ncbi:MAG: hypothetical protein FDX30_05515 [Chlorobium sp.]|nr:MAG: hypothetical protein FDX30_05515 [Chlorobium sp.]
MHWIAPAEKDSANFVLEKRLWDAADQLRDNSGSYHEGIFFSLQRVLISFQAQDQLRGWGMEKSSFSY